MSMAEGGDAVANNAVQCVSLFRESKPLRQYAPVMSTLLSSLVRGTSLREAVVSTGRWEKTTPHLMTTSSWAINAKFVSCDTWGTKSNLLCPCCFSLVQSTQDASCFDLDWLWSSQFFCETTELERHKCKSKSIFSLELFIYWDSDRVLSIRDNAAVPCVSTLFPWLKRVGELTQWQRATCTAASLPCCISVSTMFAYYFLSGCAPCSIAYCFFAFSARSHGWNSCSECWHRSDQTIYVLHAIPSNLHILNIITLA